MSLVEDQMCANFKWKISLLQIGFSLVLDYPCQLSFYINIPAEWKNTFGLENRDLCRRSMQNALHPFTSLYTEWRMRLRLQPIIPSFYSDERRNCWRGRKIWIAVSYWHADWNNIENYPGCSIFFSKPKKLIVKKVNISLDVVLQRDLQGRQNVITCNCCFFFFFLIFFKEQYKSQ